MRIIALCTILVLIGLSGCCLQSVKLKPQINAIDLEAAKVGSFNAETEFDFKECCPSKEQEKIALSIQSKITNLYDKLLNDEITIDKFNEKVQAASNAIGRVVFICNSANKVMKTTISETLDEAWENLKRVDQDL
jgi:hypothetical protein